MVIVGFFDSVIRRGYRSAAPDGVGHHSGTVMAGGIIHYAIGAIVDHGRTNGRDRYFGSRDGAFAERGGAS
jgi:hypothetical protein